MLLNVLLAPTRVLGCIAALVPGLRVSLCTDWQALRSLRPASDASGSKPDVRRGAWPQPSTNVACGSGIDGAVAWQRSHAS